MQITANTVKHVFSYHAPTEGQPVKYERIRTAARELAEDLLDECPPSRELSLALTHLQEAVMWANASIALNPPSTPAGLKDPPRPLPAREPDKAPGA